MLCAGVRCQSSMACPLSWLLYYSDWFTVHSVMIVNFWFRGKSGGSTTESGGIWMISARTLEDFLPDRLAALIYHLIDMLLLLQQMLNKEYPSRWLLTINRCGFITPSGWWMAVVESRVYWILRIGVCSNLVYMICCIRPHFWIIVLLVYYFPYFDECISDNFD